MKRIIILVLLVYSWVGFFSAPVYALDIEAASAILINADSGQVLFEQDAHQILPVASLTKIVTALVTLEHYNNLRQTYTLPAAFANVGESALGLMPGETLTIEDLLYALMLRSANDAGQALALAVGGSESSFAKMMNNRCIEAGLTESNWVNPHGLHDEAHLSSAYDMAYITREAMKIPMFNTLIKAPSHTIPWEGQIDDRIVTSHNRLLTNYDGADGVKTGYTSKAGNCLVGSATRHGLRLIGVVLNSEDTYTQMASLLDYGFAKYELRQVAAYGDIAARLPLKNARQDSISIYFGSTLNLLISKEQKTLPLPDIQLPEYLDTPIDSQEPVGLAVFQDSSGNIQNIQLYPTENIERFTLLGLIKAAFLQIMRVML